MIRFILLLVTSLLGSAVSGAERFQVSGDLKIATNQPTVLQVRFRMPPHHHLYADKIQVKSDVVKLVAKEIAPSVRKYDATLEKETDVYEHDFTLSYTIEGRLPPSLPVSVDLQGCSDSICFMPETKELLLATEATNAPIAAAGQSAVQAQTNVLGGEVLGRASGYLPPGEFLAFLDATDKGAPIPGDQLARTLETRGLWLTLGLILLGGLALNLTPCVLPMIPINIAIIGAGAQAGSRKRGFALGTVYGSGIALVYGLLGLFVVLTGAKFGTLNASPWFNLAIAALFSALSLGMFGIITIDFSRLQSQSSGTGRRGGFGLAFFMGGVAALLAGACVAPVVISVLILAADLYARHIPAALLLPFFLGIGMALPWPFAGAGLSFLPKPGRWMERVKYAFGVLILLFAAWYGYLGFTLLHDRMPSTRQEAAAAQSENAKDGIWSASIGSALEESRRNGKPVLIDFWATWCKNCLKMEKTTYKDPAVLNRLKDFVPVKYQAEDLRAPDVKRILDQYGVIGLPTYVVLRVNSEFTPQKAP